MSDLSALHDEHGAEFTDVGGRSAVAHYGRPERTCRAVRNAAGAIEMPYGVLRVSGSDRLAYVDDVITNSVPETDGESTYAFLLDPQGHIETELWVFNAGDHLLVLTPPGKAAWLDAEWEVFVEDVSFEVRTNEVVAFGVHGPKATEKIASVLSGGPPPESRGSFVRGSFRSVGTTVVRTDGPLGEAGYEVICAREDGRETFDTLLNYGMNAVPFGRETWNSLTLEAGTPVFPAELDDRIPNETGVRAGLDFEKGCFVGQEVVSRIENRGQPPRRLVGLRPAAVPSPGAAVFAGDSSVGEVTRALESPIREEPIAMAYVDFASEADADLTVRVDGDPVAAERVDLPFVEGSERSGRLPTYE